MADGRLWVAMEALEPRGAAPWQRRLRAYLGGGQRGTIEVSPRFAATAEALASRLRESAAAGIADRWPSQADPDISLALTLERERDCGLPHIVALDHLADPVGVFEGGDVYVAPPWRGRGIGSELLLARAVLHDGGRREGFLYSPAGLAAAVRSHLMAVRMALARGKDVPAGTLADHGQEATRTRPSGP